MRNFSSSHNEHYNDDSIFFYSYTQTHTWHHFPLSLSLRLNPMHRAIVHSHHRLSTLREHTPRSIYNQE